MSVEDVVNLLSALTKENAIILILILLLFVDRVKVWANLIEASYRRWLKLDKKQANKNLENYTTKVTKIHEILEIYRKSLNAARVGYYVLHNGGTDIRGIPFLKYSCLNEAVAYGVRPRLRLDKDVHIATVSHWTKNFTSGEPAIDFVDKLSQNGIRSSLEEFGVIKCAMIPVYEDSLLSGFITVEWKFEKYVLETDDEIREQIVQCSKLMEINSIKDINHFLSY